MAADARARRALVWMFIFAPIGIVMLMRSQSKPALPALRAGLWGLLGFIFACYAITDLARGHLIDMPVSLAIVATATWRVLRNRRLLQVHQ